MSLFPRKPSEEPAYSPEELGDEYYVYPAEAPVHTAENPFCDDMTCPCHENTDAINDLNGYYQDGLASQADADRIFRGKTL